MPPKKRQRLSPPDESATAATPREAPSKQHGSGAPSPDDLVNDPWTDEQNTALMKGLIKWKPVGMHKHFRMLSLANYLHTHGHEAEHTRIPGIWTKLNTLYNMKTLDEREDSYGDTMLRDSSEDRSATPSSQATGQTAAGDDGGSVVGGGRASSKKDPPYFPFRLPEEPDFRARLFDKRIGTEPPSSPPTLKHQVSTSEKEPAIAESFSMYDAEDLGRAGSAGKSRDSTPAAGTTTARGGRGGRGRGRGGRGAAAAVVEGSTRRASKAKEEAAPPVRGGRGGRGRPRRQAEAAAEEEEEESDDENEDEDEDGEEGDGTGEEQSAEESEEESGENDDEEDEDAEDAEDDEEEESPEESEKKPPARTRGTRGKGRGRGGGRGRGRGRRG